jgi:hypothetical protein
MDRYEMMAARASRIELAVEHYFVLDDGKVDDYRGPQLAITAHTGRLVTIHELGRQLDPLSPVQMNALVELALAACDEVQADFGIDTACGRPTTSYQLHVYRALHARTAHATHQINHYGPAALGPAFSAFLVALREATGPLAADARGAWDHAARWIAARDLGPLYGACQPVPMPSIVGAFADDETVYLRAGQPPQRSELYRLDGDQLVWLRGNNDTVALTMYDGPRYQLPCGAARVEVHHEWQRPRRLYIRVDDPARGIYVQRGA